MNFLLVALGLAAGWAAGTAGARRMVRREIDELRDLIEKQQAGSMPPPETSPAPAASAEPPAPVSTPAPPPEPVSGEISEEILAVLTAAVAAFLGKKARIRGVRRMPAHGSNAWAQQGRVFVQGSHNLQRRGF